MATRFNANKNVSLRICRLNSDARPVIINDQPVAEFRTSDGDKRKIRLN